jgi:hypothetical protein
MEEGVRDAVFGNIGTFVTFRVGPFDAEVLKTVFEPTFTPEDLVGLGLGEIYLTLMIDGSGSLPFSADTIPPIDTPTTIYREDIIARSRARYARVRPNVEQSIRMRQESFSEPQKKKTPAPAHPRPAPLVQTRSPAEILRQKMQQKVDTAPPSMPRASEGEVSNELLRKVLERGHERNDS